MEQSLAAGSVESWRTAVMKAKVVTFRLNPRGDFDPSRIERSGRVSSIKRRVAERRHLCFLNAS
jgi:hypothetical protein